jgi:hypothetical protein
MKRFLLIIALILMLFSTSAYANEIVLGAPVPLTVTVTNLTATAITDSGNSATAWTFVRGSNLGALRWTVSEPSGTYDIKGIYTSTTYASTDYWIWKKSETPKEAYLYLPNGIYVSVTFSTVYSGDSFSTQIFYEGQK